jgi:hypothetical protein
LEKSIHNEVRRDKNLIIGRVISDMPYSRVLELGGSRIQARPYLRPALYSRWADAIRILGGKDEQSQ